MPRRLANLTHAGALAVVLVIGAAAVATSQSHNGRPVPAGPAGTGLWISDTPLEDGRRLPVAVDPSTRHAAIYHLDAASGSLTLKSARDLTWDLSIDEFNAQDPRPAALRTMLHAVPAGPP